MEKKYTQAQETAHKQIPAHRHAQADQQKGLDKRESANQPIHQQENAPNWEELVPSITKQWSVPFLFPHQQLCVHYILTACGYFGEDAEHNKGILASLPTGSGKSLCFMAPAGLLDGISIIFYPLNALLRDQRRRFDSAGVHTVLYYGGLEPKEKQKAIREIRSMHSGVIISNIESASSERFQALLKAKRIRLIVIDEGHLILQWGRSFRPTLLNVGELRKAMGYPVTAVFTATITKADRDELAGLLWPQNDWDYFEMLSDRTNISYRMIPCADEITALRVLLRQGLDEHFDLLARHAEVTREIALPILVFVPRRDDCEALARLADIWLRLWGRGDVRTWYYHAGLSSAERKAIERDFAQCSSAILFTTKAFGTGVDIPGIRTTIHYREPETMEDFLQESGRAGRDGNPAFSYVLQREKLLFKDDGCRRRQALRALGQEPPLCSGCDYCEGIDWKLPLEAIALQELRRINALILPPQDEFRIIRLDDFANLSPEAYRSIASVKPTHRLSKKRKFAIVPKEAQNASGKGRGAQILAKEEQSSGAENSEAEHRSEQ